MLAALRVLLLCGAMLQVSGRSLKRIRCDGCLRLRGGATSDPLDSEEARTLYAMGCSVGQQIGDLTCLPPCEIDTLLIGVRDVLTRSKPQVDLNTYMPKAAELLQARAAAEAERAAQAGAAALAAAASKPGAVQTESGLVIESIVDGDGDFPTVADTVRFNFVARLPDGTEIDSTFRRGTPVEVPVGGK